MTQSKPPKGWHEIISDLKPHLSESWCEQQFGKRWSHINNNDGVWTVFWTGLGVEDREIKYKASYRYLFKEEKDAMLFSLRWL